MPRATACPAAEIKHPVTSRNRDDVLCRIQGHMQPLEGSKCQRDYFECGIWRREQDRVRFFARHNRVAPKTREPRKVEEIVGPKL